MSFLNSLFQNETFKNMALGTLKKEMNKNGIKYVVIDMRDDGELDIVPYSSDSKPMVLGADAVNKTRQILEEQERTIQEQREFIDSLNAENNRLNDQLGINGLVSEPQTPETNGEN